MERLVSAAIAASERGLVPDWGLRRAIRWLCGQRLASIKQSDAAAAEASLRQFIADASRQPIAPVPEQANAQHYEVPAEFFQFVLGPRLKYSSCYWPEGVDSLAAAEEAALAETCQHAEISDGMRILELGCGWGSLTLWMAEHFPSCHITAVSNSHSQREFIERAAHERGLATRVRVLTADMNDFATDERFDRVVSVEMFEHMRNHRELLKRISGWLLPGGKLLVHIFCHREHNYAFETEGAANWMGRYFFTGGIMPSDNLLEQYDEHLRVTNHWRWDGVHYQRTADAWLAKLRQHRGELLPVLERCHGQADSGLWFHRWRMFFLAVSELFGFRGGKDWFVSHYLLGRVDCVGSSSGLA